MRLLKTHFLKQRSLIVKSHQNRIELVTRPGSQMRKNRNRVSLSEKRYKSPNMRDTTAESVMWHVWTWKVGKLMRLSNTWGSAAFALGMTSSKWGSTMSTNTAENKPNVINVDWECCTGKQEKTMIATLGWNTTAALARKPSTPGHPGMTMKVRNIWVRCAH